MLSWKRLESPRRRRSTSRFKSPNERPASAASSCRRPLKAESLCLRSWSLLQDVECKDLDSIRFGVPNRPSKSQEENLGQAGRKNLSLVQQPQQQSHLHDYANRCKSHGLSRPDLCNFAVEDLDSTLEEKAAKSSALAGLTA